MLRIGLTGGIASGKSTVAALFSRRGVTVIDTDAIAHELVRPGSPVLGEIIDRFGADMRTADGALDRARLRKRVFADTEERRSLEAILHPRIRAEVQSRLARVSEAPYVVIVVPLLIETDFAELVDRILVVDASESQQHERAVARGMDPTIARQVIAAQVSRSERRARADDIIDNTASSASLEQAVATLHERYLALARASTA